MPICDPAQREKNRDPHLTDLNNRYFESEEDVVESKQDPDPVPNLSAPPRAPIDMFDPQFDEQQFDDIANQPARVPGPPAAMRPPAAFSSSAASSPGLVDV